MPPRGAAVQVIGVAVSAVDTLGEQVAESAAPTVIGTADQLPQLLPVFDSVKAPLAVMVVSRFAQARM